MRNFKPMLAYSLKQEDYEQGLQFPLITSPKVDGIRCIIQYGIPVTRNLKPIRNRYASEILSGLNLDGLDGEIVVGEPNAPQVYRETSSGIMSFDGMPNFTFWVFDTILFQETAFVSRYERVKQQVEQSTLKDFVKVLPHKTIYSLDELLQFETDVLNQGYEGVMVRAVSGLYKFGRSTFKEQGLMKVKRFQDAEGVIVGFIEERKNNNEATVDNLGHTKRSLSQEGMVGKDTLGALIITYKDTTVEVGSGFTKEQRKEIWDNQDKYLGKSITYKYFDHGEYDKPRHPVFKGVREDL